MEQDKFEPNYQEYTDNNNILLEIVDDLQQLKSKSNDDLITEGLTNIINKINGIIDSNKKNLEILESLKTQFSSLYQKLDELKVNTEELIYEDGRYVGQVVNGLAEGKGIAYFNNGDQYEGECSKGKAEGRGMKSWANGDKYEGDYRNDKKECKGIYYYNNGDKYEGDWKNGKREGKGIYYYNIGDRYEGEWKDDKKDGSGIYYYHNGDRKMGDYLDDKPIGKHVFFIKNDEKAYIVDFKPNPVDINVNNEVIV